jgi:membrane associated rhomboid family serine protease
MLGLVFFGPYLERVWGTGRFIIFYFVCGIGAGLIYLGINYIELSQLQQAGNAYLTDPNPDAFASFFSRFASEYYRSQLNLIQQFSLNPDNEYFKQITTERVHQIMNVTLNAPMVGASGAVFGILAGFGLLFPNTELMFFPLPIPIKAKFVVLFYGATAVFGALHNTPGDNVAHYAHIGGMLFGWIMVLIWKNKRDTFY